MHSVVIDCACHYCIEFQKTAYFLTYLLGPTLEMYISV